VTLSLVGSVTDLIIAVLRTVGLPGLLALMAVESFGLPPIPSEVILPFTGFLVADGTFSFAGATSVALAGGLLGAFAGYAVGRWWRHRITGLGVGRLRLEPRHLDRVDRYFARHGESTVALTRMVPVIRSYVSYPAGTAKMDPVKFGVYTFLGSVPFTVALIYAGTVLRSNWTAVAGYLTYLDYPLIALIVGVVLFFLLQIAGYLEPGWPPRRRARAPVQSAPSGSSGSPPPGPSSP
jgi:membrane protein DedA with SNARE-associated domain